MDDDGLKLEDKFNDAGRNLSAKGSGLGPDPEFDDDYEEDIDIGTDSAKSEDEDYTGSSGVRLLRKIFHHGFHPQWGVLLSPEKQPVVIEALSLLRMATGNEAIDFSRGGETLHAIYAIERILAKLCQSTSHNVVVAFFNCLANDAARSEISARDSCSSDNAGYLAEVSGRRLAMEVLRKHLSHSFGTPDDQIDVCSFDSWTSRGWKEFVKNCHPSLVLVDVPEEDPEEDDDDEYLTTRDLRRLLILDMLSSGLRVVSANMQFCALRTQTFELLPTNLVFQTWKGEICASLRERINTTAGPVPTVDAAIRQISVNGAEPDTLLVLRSIALALRRIDGLKSLTADPLNPSSEGFERVVAKNPDQTLEGVFKGLRSPPSADQCVQFCKIFLLMHAVLKSCPLRKRLFDDTQLNVSEKGKKQLSAFLGWIMLPAMQHCVHTEEIVRGTEAYLSDLVDGRLFFFIAAFAANTPMDSVATLGVNKVIVDQLDEFWKLATTASSSSAGDLFPIAAGIELAGGEPTVKEKHSNEASWLAELDCDFLEGMEPDLAAWFNKRGIFSDTGDACRIVGDEFYSFGAIVEFDPELDDPNRRPTSAKWEMKSKQRYYSFLEKFSKTLKNAGSVQEQVVMARSDGLGWNKNADSADGKKGSARGKGKKGGGGGGGGGKRGGGGKKGQSRKAEILEKNSKRLEAKDIEKVESRIRTASTSSDRVLQLSRRLNVLKGQGCAENALLTGYLKLIEWLMEDWCNECTDKKPEERNLQPAINIFRLTFDILHIYDKVIHPEHVQTFQGYMYMLGFPDAGKDIYGWYEKTVGKPGARKAVFKESMWKGDAVDKFRVGMSFARFQLMHCGSLMQRTFDSRSDPRVKGFHPDAWQRKLLDVVDKRDSALVVAPTSSGKTLVSFYSMQCVLEQNRKENRFSRFVAYVCPTKALVNQVAAEVYYKFGAVVGVNTRDYKHNEDKCQVLITVPDVLESLLLDVSWAKRIEYCILDEIHCIDEISDSEGSSSLGSSAAAWEHIIRLLPCPFVALSATIGNPNKFHDWLVKSEKLHKRRIQLVTHEFRWGDLMLKIYNPPDAGETVPEFKTTKTAPDAPGLVAMHPIISLSVTEIAEQSILSNVRLATDETVQLYDAMVAVANKTDGIEVKSLDPESVFGLSRCIVRDEVYTYEDRLKACLSSWARDHKQAVEEVLLSLAGDVCALAVFCFRSHIHLQKHGPNAEYPSMPRFSESRLLHLLTELNAQQQLPAIVFTFDRRKATRGALRVLEVLEEQEEAEKQTPEYQAQIKEQERRRQQILKEEKRKRDKKEKERLRRQKEGNMDEIEEMIPPAQIEGPDQRFSFVRPQDRMEKEELDYWTKRVWRKVAGQETMKKLVHGLARGVGVHHAGLPLPYRQAVEVLFRSGHLRIVLATGTLALGINMPCRTVVFFDDSPFLTPLMYRQMSGRAGRRGYDDIGQVVFSGITKQRVHALVASQLTSLVGCHPISSGLTLDLAMAWAKTKETERPDLLTRYKAVLEKPLFTTATQDMDEAKALHDHVKYLFRLYMGLLHANRLVDITGAPVDLAELSSNLKQKEPSNVIICYMLANGVIDEICKDFHDDREGVAQRLLRALSVIFNTIPVMPQQVGVANRKKSHGRESESVLLTDVPKEMVDAVEEYNKKTMQIMQQYFRSVFEGKGSSKPPVLPLSGKISHLVRERDCTDGVTGALEPVLRSPFVALSGGGDDFQSPQDIADSADASFHLEADHVPVTSQYEDVRGQKMMLNSYCIAYFKHVSRADLVSKHGLKEGRAWELLKEWSLLLKAMVAMMTKVRGHNRHHPTLACLNYLSTEFSTKFARFNN